ncbi:MAG: glycosyltransferase family 4 protein [Chthonomonas sp.]|nr:glycosyltransferase family 4 protein [Chthonomonas sp.]
MIAIDARLCGTQNTGDSVHWNGILAGLNELNLAATFLLFVNHEPAPTVPLGPDFRVVRVPARNSRWWSLWTFPMAARRMGAQVLHTQYSLSPLARGGVSTIHDMSVFAGPEWFLPRDRMILQRSIPAAVRTAKAVVAVSHTSLAELEKYVPGAGAKTSVVYNALPVGFRPIPREEAKRIVADKLGITEPFLLTVGTRWPRKNMALAIQAFTLSERAQHLVVTGKAGWGEENIPPRTTVTGYVPDELMPALYAAADLYLAPSRYEGFGIPLLEAWACDCPVLCSAGPGFPEVAGDAAAIEPSWEARDWAARIDTLLADSGTVQALRERGRARLAEFSWRTSAQVLWETYERVIRAQA